MPCHAAVAELAVLAAQRLARQARDAKVLAVELVLLQQVLDQEAPLEVRGGPGRKARLERGGAEEIPAAQQERNEEEEVRRSLARSCCRERKRACESLAAMKGGIHSGLTSDDLAGPLDADPGDAAADDGEVVVALVERVELLRVEQHVDDDVVHPAALGHGERDRGEPGQDAECPEDQAERRKREQQDGEPGVRPAQHGPSPRAVRPEADICEGAVHGWGALELDGHLARRLALVLLDAQVRACIGELANAEAVALDDRPVHRGEPQIVLRSERRAVREQQLDADRVALVRGPHQGGVPLRVARVDAGAALLARRLLAVPPPRASRAVEEGRLLQQEEQGHHGAAVDDEVQRVEALRVLQQRVGALLEEQVHDEQVSAARRPLQRGGIELAAARVDLGALLDEVGAHGRMRVDRAPVQRRDALGIAVVRLRVPAADQRAERGEVAPLRCGEDRRRRLGPRRRRFSVWIEVLRGIFGWWLSGVGRRCARRGRLALKLAQWIYQRYHWLSRGARSRSEPCWGRHGRGRLEEEAGAAVK